MPKRESVMHVMHAGLMTAIRERMDRECSVGEILLKDLNEHESMRGKNNMV